MNRSLFSAITAAIANRFSRFSWNAPTQQFSAAKVVPPESVRVIVDKQIAATGKRLEKAGDTLKKAKGTDGWERAVQAYAGEFRTELKALHLQVGSLGNGGLHAMPKEAYDRTEGVLRAQFGYHDDIVKRLLDEPDYVDSGRFAGHGDGYARTARFTYENERRESHSAEGFGYQHRWTHAINSCAQCAELEAEGWVSIGSQPELGACTCGPGCDCTVEYSRENPDE